MHEGLESEARSEKTALLARTGVSEETEVL